MYFRVLGSGLGRDLLALMKRELFADLMADNFITTEDQYGKSVLVDSICPNRFLLLSGMKMAFEKIEATVDIGRQITEGK